MARINDRICRLAAADLHPAPRLPKTAFDRFCQRKAQLPRRTVDHCRRFGGLFRQGQRGRHPDPDEIPPHRLKRFYLCLRGGAVRIFRSVFAHLPLRRPHYPPADDLQLGGGLLYQGGRRRALPLCLYLHGGQYRDDNRIRPRCRGAAPDVQLRREQFCQLYGPFRNHGEFISPSISLSL